MKHAVASLFLAAVEIHDRSVESCDEQIFLY
jgi:hypothetical protein